MISNNFSWEYDSEVRHYIARNASLRFVNFAGVEQNYNQKGRRNFRLEVSDELAREMEQQGVYIRTTQRELEDGTIDRQNLLKISVYPDAYIRLLNGKAMVPVTIDNDDPSMDGGLMLDREFSKGHAVNGEVKLEFHVSKNTKVAGSSPYLRLDRIYIPIRKSSLEEEYEAYEAENR